MNNYIKGMRWHQLIILGLFVLITVSCQLLQFTFGNSNMTNYIYPPPYSNTTIVLSYNVISATTNYQVNLSLISNVRFDSVKYPNMCIDFTNLSFNLGEAGADDCLVYLYSTNNQSNTSVYTLVPEINNQFLLSNDDLINTNVSDPGYIVECLDGNNAYTTPIYINLWAEDGSTVQFWQLDNISNNIYTIYNRYHGYAIWVSNGTGGTPYDLNDPIWEAPLYGVSGASSNAFQWYLNIVSTVSNYITDGMSIISNIVITDETVITDNN